MSSALQNRLVGTVIAVALVVIFLPDFLDGKKETKTTHFASVPAAPEKKPIVEPDAFPADRVAKAAQRPLEIVKETPVDDQPAQSEQNDIEAANSVQAEQQAETNDLAQRTVVSQQVNDNDAGWVVQLGSFRHQKNVKQLLGKLESAGYRAFSRPIRTSSGLLTKVFVGPDLNKQKLEAALPHLTEVTGLKGKITEFKVE
ncbi:SPOR domain-containing protein [Salinimonas sediminis]|uniref:SPOR domain-containing protein n=1 Tax=Salinimonas sediminis TaxID=2303538 RepID=A0A346NNE9_9ALTE|nr:SPOR domain-containing protein [Salinimonas sediminis]AXR07056.1 SPOR domain-containing protein [Salinimonas sediminis]